MLADDDATICSFVSDVLVDEGHDVLIAHDGAAALDLVQEHSPQLVLLDDSMPGCDARCFMDDYRQRAAPRAPVILVTASHDASRRAAQVEADDYLGKPFELDALLDMVARYAA